VLRNGARFYVDHAHPEYAAPETASARDAALWDKAGERVALAAVRALAATPGGPDVGLYKNNTDGKGASYGMHENYLVDRAVPFEDLVAFITPFLVTRQIFAGSGRVGLGQRGQEPGFQLSQRADFIEAEVGLETTLRRPIVNTRDEPHADPRRWRRLHVIVGDATMMEVATYLRVGATSLVLAALEAGAWGGGFLAQVRLAAPVPAFWEVSRDLGVNRPLALASGETATAVSIQRRYLDLVARLGGGGVEMADLTGRWARLLDGLERDPLSAAREVEWVAKYRLLAALAAREAAGWASPKVAAADLQWTDIRPERSLAGKVAAAGATEALFTESEVARAVSAPPRDTRAWERGRAVAEGGGRTLSANWDSFTAVAADDAVPHRHFLPDPADDAVPHGHSSPDL
jgi:proteasome accessory factor A